MIYLTNINLNQNELQNAIIQPLAVAPANPKLGQIYCDSVSSKIMWYNGTAWKTIGVVVESSATNGHITVDGVDMTVYELPIASADTLGGIKVGVGLAVDANGVLSATGGGTADAVEWDNVLNKPGTFAPSAHTHDDRYYTETEVDTALGEKVDKVTGKGLSTNDFTTAEKNKLAGITAGAEVNVQPDWGQIDNASDDFIKNKPTTMKNPASLTVGGKTYDGSAAVTIVKSDIGLGNVDNTADADKPVSTATQTALGGKVDKVTGKGLSTNDYTTTEKNKLAAIAQGAEVNVNADWEASSGDAQILHKPTALSDFTNDEGFIDNTVNNLVNYYLKTETYTKTEVNSLIGEISTIQIQVVATLPATGSSNIIYLVPKSPAETSNAYDEYIWVASTSSFEKVGDTEIDLSNYLQKTGDGSNVTAAFTAAASRALPATGEKLSVIFGKIVKYLTDLKAVAYSGSYSDLSNKPTLVKSATLTIATNETTKSTTLSGTTILGVTVRDSVTHEVVLCDTSINGMTVTVTVNAAPTNALSAVVSYL